MNDDQIRGVEKERFESFWKIACNFIQFWVTLFYLNIIFLIALVITFLFELTPGTFTIAVLDFALVAVVLTGTGYIIYKCQKRAL